MRRRCASPKTTIWSTHSRRIDPINRSAKPFCQGEAGAVGLSRMPIARNRRLTDSRHRLIPIAVKKRGTLIPGEGLGYLACDPFSCRICCDIDPDQVPAVQPDDNEGIEQVEANGRDNEQIHGSDIRRVVARENPPPLTWRSTPLDHVLGNARLRDLKPELEQFAVDTRCSPKRVLDAHSPDQSAQLRADLRPPAKRARLPTPVPPENYIRE